ncbi:MAG: type 1 glutamine amidotransferase [Halobacteriaceae archaeon]
MTRRRSRVALLDASHGATHTPRNFRREVDASVAEFKASSGELPDGYGYDAVVVTGSGSSVYWEEPWIDDLTAWVHGAVERGLPTLGICFGHQLVATALGGEVAPMDDYEIGYREVERTGGADPLLAGVDETFLAFTTHSDEVVELPPGAEPIASNDRSLQGFRAGDAFGVQFHPEYDMATAAKVTRDKDLPEERIESVLDGITAENYRAACEAKQLFENFLDYAREVRSEAESAEAEPV